jgi:hydroxymethylbilane synthase
VGGRLLAVGTRGSRLALHQTQLVLDLLRAQHPEMQIAVREIRTEGDKRPGESLARIGGQGVFVKGIEAALLRREIDFAVHSLKDVPADIADGCALAAIPRRADPRDALVTRAAAKLADLRSGARIGTGSARRAVQLRTLRADIETADIRGNVDTRVRKVDDGEYDAAVLAVAGLDRLGLLDRATEVFDADVMLPAVGQGALAVEARADDTGLLALLSAIDHRESRLACEAERAFLTRLGGGCRLPFGALAKVEGEVLRIRGFISDDTGNEVFRSEITGSVDDSANVGVRLAEQLLSLNSVGHFPITGA